MRLNDYPQSIGFKTRVILECAKAAKEKAAQKTSDYLKIISPINSYSSIAGLNSLWDECCVYSQCDYVPQWEVYEVFLKNLIAGVTNDHLAEYERAAIQFSSDLDELDGPIVNDDWFEYAVIIDEIMPEIDWDDYTNPAIDSLLENSEELDTFLQSEVTDINDMN